MDNKERKHALLGASSSHRWLRCTPSAVAEAAYPDSGSDYAKEGTLAHALAARELKRSLQRDTRDEDEEIAELRGQWHTPEMDEYVEGYAAFVAERMREARERAARTGGLAPKLGVEVRLDYSRWVPDGFGTGDAVIIGDGDLEVIDLKYGKGVEVKATGNTQMMLYALGALDLYDYAYEIDTVMMTVYQPRINNVSTWRITAKELRRWADEELVPLARLAAVGKGVRDSGPWCRFCRAKGDCVRLAAESMQTWQLNADAGQIRREDLPQILVRLDTIKDWVKAIEERALARALQGEEIPGWTVVEGRSVRKITDPRRAATILLEAAGGLVENVYKPSELLPLTTLERTWGKKRLGTLLKDCIEKPQGKPTLVSEDDKREPLKAGDEFKSMLNS